MEGGKWKWKSVWEWERTEHGGGKWKREAVGIKIDKEDGKWRQEIKREMKMESEVAKWKWEVASFIIPERCLKQDIYHPPLHPRSSHITNFCDELHSSLNDPIVTISGFGTTRQIAAYLVFLADSTNSAWPLSILISAKIKMAAV
jgi:hypothetical protein